MHREASKMNMWGFWISSGLRTSQNIFLNSLLMISPFTQRANHHGVVCKHGPPGYRVACVVSTNIPDLQTFPIYKHSRSTNIPDLQTFPIYKHSGSTFGIYKHLGSTTPY